MNRGSAGGGGGRLEAASLLDMARKLLDARDLSGSKTFAERAMEADPLIDGVDWILATADVLLAAQRRRINNHVDLYAILQIDPSSGRGTSEVRLQYSRLARLLHPRHRQSAHGFQSFSISAAADEAFKLVCDAWAVLSDPVKKDLYDKEIDIAGATQMRLNGGSARSQDGGSSGGNKASVEAEVDPGPTFWTACTSCFRVYQYACGYEGRTLICQNCRKAFQATEMASPPPIVPGTDTYFCAWGLYPLGFPGGPNFVPPTMLNSASEPAVGNGSLGEPSKQNSSFPVVKRGRGRPKGSTNKNVRRVDASGTPATSGKSPNNTRNKMMAKRPRKQVGDAEGSGITFAGDAEISADPRSRAGAEIREGVEAAKSYGGNNMARAGCSRAVDISAEDLDLNFTIDIDTTNSILDSLSTLPFLKDDDIVVCGKIPAHFKGNV
ncbi:hypothetical protein Taro_006449 [Colocasia esculenta]|uniref:J domain-containing protein n=1 Tax=Colocasia esculenta TaxID=4460 RepID=A0A843TNR2_COLES|nr:hypothetical protein [Colocasia esculenta]